MENSPYNDIMEIVAGDYKGKEACIEIKHFMI